MNFLSKLRGLAFLATAALLLPLAAVGAIALVADHSRIFKPNGPLHDWQDLIAGGCAIVAAFIGGGFLHLEGRRTADQAHQGERALLPSSLNEVSDYARHCAAAIGAFRSNAVGELVPTLTPSPAILKLSKDSPRQIADCLATAPGQVVPALSELLFKLQIQLARVSDIPFLLSSAEHTLTLSNLEQMILDCAGIYARASLLFDYGHRRSNQARSKVAADAMRTALSQLGFVAEREARLFDRVHRDYGNGA